jgi:hypothetical protein
MTSLKGLSAKVRGLFFDLRFNPDVCANSLSGNIVSA